jgi:flagellar basal-body rod protein FlgB
MSPIYLFDIASQRSHWLSLRQEAVAGNIANANTPGYAAQEVQPFDSLLQSSRLAMATSSPGHVAPSSQSPTELIQPQDDNWHVYSSGNSVSIEEEMVKASEVNTAFSLNNSVVKAFHRMMLTSTKG